LGPPLQVNYAVWEVRPAQSSVKLISTGPVTAGDYIDAAVTYLAGEKYRITLTDNSWEWTFTKTVTQAASSAAPKMAEWIIEAGKAAPLANFGTRITRSASGTPARAWSR
jgi:Peptidase A4 family